MGAVKNHFWDEINAQPAPREPVWIYTYRDWTICFDPPPIPTRNCDWQFWHKDFDGAEDAGDSRSGHAASLEAAQAEIDEIEAEAVQ